jgi:serine/threonine protein kinase
MTPERWKQIARLMDSARVRPADERSAFLDQACAGDQALRIEVELLLAAEEQTHSSLTNGVTEPAPHSMAGEDSATGTIGPYKLLTSLGAGGMGDVYLAEDTRLGRQVALKLLPRYLMDEKDRVRRFKQEARAASALNHPNVATIYDIGEAAGTVYIAMEYVEGQTLDKKINGRPLSAAEIVNIAAQVADALSEAHAKGIIHRDIKPSNIMLTARGQVKVLDFGLAKVLGLDRFGSNLSTQVKTEPGVVLGTVTHMSPEQALGRDVDQRTDIFSLGVVLYEMATGRRPFAEASPTQTIDRILHAEPDPISRFNYGAPAELEHITGKCLRKDPAERYQTAKDLTADLVALRRQLSGSTGAIRSVEPDYFISRTWARGLFLLIQCIYVAVYVLVLLWGRDVQSVFHTLFGSPVGSLLFQGYVVSAVVGIAVRLYLISSVGFDHVLAGVQYRRVFIPLFVLDALWAMMPLSLTPRLGELLALACIPPMAFSPFAQRTLMRSAYDLHAAGRTSTRSGRR